MSTRAKEIRKLRKSVAQGTAAIIEIAEEWTTESTALEIATERRVIAGIGQLEGIKVQCSLIDKYTPYIGFLKELINYIGIRIKRTNAYPRNSKFLTPQKARIIPSFLH